MSKYIGTPVVSLSTDTVDVTGDITTTDATPEVIIVNDTHEDTDGGREGKVTFKGQQSGGEETTLANIEASHDGTSDDEKGFLAFRTNSGSNGANPTTAMVIDSAQNVGIGTASVDVSTQAGGSGYKALQIESDEGGQINFDHNDAGTGSTLGQINFQRAGEVVAEIEGVTDGATDNGRIAFRVQPDGGALTEAMRITHEGSVQIGTTTDRPDNYNGSGSGTEFSTLGLMRIARNGDCVVLNRVSTEGDVLNFSKDGSGFGTIGINGGSCYIGGGDVGIAFYQVSEVITPIDASNGNAKDNSIKLGFASGRFTEVFAVNNSINTSDENEKQDIASLTNAEITAAKAISKLFKTYKWKDAVDKKGDNARTHTGVVAQQIQSAMSDAGLDASKYAFWCSDTWWETQTEVAAVEADEENAIKAKDAYTKINVYETKDEAPEGATERTRLGIRYPELLAFIGAATEQRLTSIEARLTALEGE